MDSKFFKRCIFLLTTSIFLISCGTKTENVDISQPDIAQPTIVKKLRPSPEELEQVRQLEEAEEWQQAFTAWEKIVKVSTDKDKALYSNKAALMLYRLNQLDVIPNYYDALNVSFENPDDINHKNILLASAYFNNGKTYQSLSALPDLTEVQELDYLTIAFDVRASAILNIGKPLQSAKIRLDLNQYLSEQDDIEKNFSNLWDSLNRLSDSSVLRILKSPQEKELRGWLELSLIARRSDMLPSKLEPWITKWHEVYSDHSAQYFADNLLEQSKNIYISPTKIALMLPLEGKLAKVSNAIQDGFLYAHYQHLKNTNSESTAPIPDIEIISVASAQTFRSQYNLAIENGADFIVGPLHKDAVEQLSTQTQLDTPTLALNYSSDENYSSNLYQFGLKPEDEADQVADYALLDQKYNAATLMPDTAWGSRLNKAFKSRYERLGGTIQSEAKYPSKSNDYGLAIKNLLNLSQSQSRHSIIQTVIGEKAEFQPRRRKDIDMIFIGANARQARIIKPQLKFHYAQDIQVYGTSHITNSNAKKSADRDRDLNGVYYVDMPWNLRSNDIIETKEIAKHWPTLTKTHGRLFALGIDAYHLIPRLRRLIINSDESYNGLTGNLKIDSQGRVHRELLLATYLKGKQVEITDSISE